MKALILAAGYGTRLQRDIQNDTSGKFNHLAGVPKPLLPIGSLPLSSHLMTMLERVNTRIDQIYLVTNGLYECQFLKWAEGWPAVKIISDGTMSNEERPGAVGCISLVIESESVQDDLLVLGGDNLFYEDFRIENFLDCFEKKLSTSGGLVTTCICSDQATWKSGIVEIDEEDRITSFLEKVGPEKTSSRLAVPCFYIFSKGSLHHVAKFLDEKKNLPLKDRDAPGHFVKYLSERDPVFTFQISGRFDVGSLESYRLCHNYFLSKK